MRADAPTEAEVMALLEKFSNACALRDTEDALRLFAQDDDILLVGSEVGKSSRGPEEIRAFFERLFSREKTYSWSWEWLSVSVAGPVAWVMAEIVKHVRGGGEEANLPYRVSVVFERCAEGWALRLVHGFEPAVAYQETSG
jgi:ketosteroid isomerase-like protein